MPLFSIKTNVALSGKRRELFVASCTSFVAELLGKDESWIMVLLETEVDGAFGASTEPFSYCQLRSVRLDETITAQLSDGLCHFLQEHLGVPADRTYLEFQNVAGHMWGWSGQTFE